MDEPVPLAARLKGLFARGGLARSAALLASGTGVAQALTLLAVPVLTRLYGPAEFGVLAVYTSLFWILLGVSSLRYELAIPLPREEKRGAELLLLCLGLTLAVALAVGTGAFFAGGRVAAWTGTPELSSTLWLLALALLGGGVHQAVSFWAVRRRNLAPIAQASVAQAAGRIAGQLAFGFLHLGALGLLLGDALGRLAGGGWLAARVGGRDARRLARADLSGVAGVARRYARFPLLSSGSALLSNAGLWVAPLLLAGTFGAAVAGFYALAHKVVGQLVLLAGLSVSQVYVGEAARLARDGGDLRRLYLRTAGGLALVAVVPLGAIAVLGPWLFALVFGGEWRQAGVYVQVLAVMFFARLVVEPLGETLAVLERQGMKLAWDVLRLLVVVGTLVAARLLALPPLNALALFAIGVAACYAVLFVLCLVGIRRGRYRRERREPGEEVER